MRRFLFLAVAAVAMSTCPSLAIEVLESAFEVHRTVDGQDVGEATTVVPLR